MFLQRLQRIANRPVLLWLLLWITVTLLYLPAWRGGYQQDFEGWLYYYNKLPFWTVMNRSFAGIQSLYQVTQFQLYVLTALFGVRVILWFLLFTGLHALNGLLLFRFAKALMRDFGLRHAGMIAAAGTALVLFNPAMTEVVMWKACYHYLAGMSAILGLLAWTRSYLMGGGSRYVWRSLLLFAPLTFTLEIWYTVPLLVLLLSIAYLRAGIASPFMTRRTLLHLFAPQMAMLGVHLIAYRVTYGLWISHSAYTSPGDDSLLTVMGRVWSYEFHLFFMGRLFPDGVRHVVYEYLGGKAGGVVALVAMAGLAVYSYRRYPHWSARSRAAAFWLGCSLISLGIILHFIPPTLMIVENDRYLYFTAFFQFMLVTIGLSWIWDRRRRAGFVLYGAVLLTMLALTGFLVMQWRHSTKVFWAVQDKFIWNDAPVVLLLNLPANYRGIGIVQSQSPSELPDHMELMLGRRPKGAVYDVAGYNMQNIWDGAHVVVTDSLHMAVTLNQWGTWWWRGGFGATDYEHDLFSVHFKDPSHYYELTLKRPLPAGAVVLYQQGLEWRVVDMRKTGAEQW